MLEPQAAARLRDSLVSTAGGYLRNPIRRRNFTCAVCATPVAGYERCFPCHNHRSYGKLADIVAPLVYAVGGRQSGYVMRGYKAWSPVEEHFRVVALLALLALSMHAECASVLAGVPVTHWATVPSLPAKSGEHPLHRIVGGSAPGVEVPLVAAAKVTDSREFDPNHFRTNVGLPAGSHVLLMDDTWAKGGHVQSAAFALRKAGAARISVMVIARWINEGFKENARFLGELPDRDYDPEICPWTGEGCPRHRT